MKVIILAAGRGSRMKSMTDSIPKCLVTLHGKPLLEWQLAAIRNAGLHDIAIVTGYQRELLANRGLTEFHNSAWSTTNMVSSLLNADEWLSNDTCIVSYSDIFYQPQAISTLMNHHADIAITYDTNWLTLWEQRFGDPLLDAETFRMTPENQLLEIGNKPQQISDIQGQYMGLLRFTPAGWQEVKSTIAALPANEVAKIHMTGLLQKIIDRNQMQIHAVPYAGVWGEVDTESDLRNYETA